MIVVLGILFLLKMSYAKNLYKNWAVDALETVLLFNLFVLTTVTYFSDSDIVTIVLAYLSTTVTLLLLLITIACHFYAYVLLPKLQSERRTSERKSVRNNTINEQSDDRFREMFGSVVTYLTPTPRDETPAKSYSNHTPKAVGCTVIDLPVELEREHHHQHPSGGESS